MRFIIYGAGAIGGLIGTRLHLAGRETVIIARGAHLEAVRAAGLRVLTPDEDLIVRVPAVGSPAEVDFRPGDVVLLCMKSQDTAPALDALRAAAGDGVPVICAQNGVANERMAARRFGRVYGMTVMMPATHLHPGVVQADSAPTHGMLDGGVYPAGRDGLITDVVSALNEGPFHCLVFDDVMRWKYAKLLSNLSNAVDVLCGREADTGVIVRAAREEAEACFRAAGVEWADTKEYLRRRDQHVQVRPVAGGTRAGSSTWQSVQRGTGAVEADYLNGEVCLLGRLHGVPTPVNRVLQREAARIAITRQPPGTMTPGEVLRLVAEATGAGSKGTPFSG